MAVSISQALVARLGVDMSEYQRGMARAPNLAKRAGKAIGTAFKLAAAAIAAVGIAAIGLGKKIFDVGATVLETRSKFNTVFGEARAGVNAFIEDFGRLAGLSRSQAQEVVATTGSIIQGMGFAQQASADFATQVVQLAGDLASFNNLPTADVAMAIQSAITGEREQIKRLGIVLRETDVTQQAFLNTGKTTVGALTQQEKVTATLQLITQRAGVAIGDLSRTSGSAANQAKQLGADWRNIIEDFSVKLLPTLQNILPLLSELAVKAAMWADKMATAMLNVGDAVGLTNEHFRVQQAEIKAIVNDLPALVARQQELTVATTNLASWLSRMAELENQFARGIFRVNGALEYNVERVEEARLKLIGYDQALELTNQLIRDFAEAGAAAGEPTAIVATVGKLADDLPDIQAPVMSIAEAWKGVDQSTKTIVHNTKELSPEIASIADSVGNQLVGGLTAVVLGFQSVGSAIKDVGKAILREIVGALVQAIIKATILKAITSAIGGPLGFLGFQRGGMISAQRGFTLPQIAPAGFGGGIPVLAHPGEAVLNRQAVERIGGEAGIHQLNRGGGGTGGMLPAPESAAGNVTYNLNVTVADGQDFERQLPSILQRLREKGRI